MIVIAVQFPGGARSALSTITPSGAQSSVTSYFPDEAGFVHYVRISFGDFQTVSS
jgi:hypothetical protein